MARAGKLNRRFRFEQRADQDDGYGNTKAVWSAVFTHAGSRRFLRGGETVQAARLEGRQPVIVKIRSSAASRAVTTDWRAVDARSGEIYNIRTVNPTDDRKYIEFMCEAGVADG